MYLRAHDPRALNLLAQGFTPRSVMRVVEENDEDFMYRQTGIIDREGDAVAHTGAKCGQWAGHTVGPYYAAFGNGLTGPQTVAGIVEGFLADYDAPLEDRLMSALEGGSKAGGQATNGIHRPERSAWLRVVGRQDYPEIDLRVDLHAHTIEEMRRLLERFKLYRDYYRERCANPGKAMPEVNFEQQLCVGDN
jgi:uncharacterized Ntn-hydrolase superfamily protein